MAAAPTFLRDNRRLAERPPSGNQNGWCEATGSEVFRQALAPTIGAVVDLADAVSECAQRQGHQPSVNSRAMEEIAAEATFAAQSGGWNEPIRDTHTFGGMTLTAAADFARSFAFLIDAGSTPIYGHLVVARSVFDACVVAAWLNDPKAGVTERVKRGLCEQLYSAMELVRLGLEEDAAERRDYWKARASAFGWTVKASSNSRSSTARPGRRSRRASPSFLSATAKPGSAKRSGAISRPSRTSLGTGSGRPSRVPRRRRGPVPASSRSGQHRRPCERRRFACSSHFARLPPHGSS